MAIATKIISIAQSYVGKKERPNNSGFFDASFELDMKKQGWSKGQPWCAFFVRLILILSYAGSAALLAIVKKCAGGGAIATFQAFEQNGTFKTSKTTPVPGAVVIWQHGNSWQGHAGIVKAIEGDVMVTIEGNTNAAGGREGDTVAEKRRLIKAPFTSNGLNIVGFIYPKES